MKDFKLSNYFLFSEMTRTNHRTLLDRNREVASDAQLLGAGYALCYSLLDPIREHFGKPMIVHSGYRCPELNKAVGGSGTSQHLKFEACDYHISGVELEEVFEWIYKTSNLRFGQVILEGATNTSPPQWIHISLGSPWREADMQVLTWQRDTGYKRLQ